MATRKKKDQVEPILHHGYKGFDKDLKCNGKQYVLGETFEELEAKLCKRGLHYCEHPLDCFGYYAPGRGSRYAQVIAENPEEETGDDSKRVTKKLTIGSELGLHGVIDAAVEFVFARVEPAKTNSNSGAWGAANNSGAGGAASNSGDWGAASNSGARGAASNSGDWGAASNSGFKGAASNSGTGGAASNSGFKGAASNSGAGGAASNSGFKGAASNSGFKGAASNSGDWGAASNSGFKGAASNSGDCGAASNSGTGGAASNSGTGGAASNSGDCGAAFNNGHEGRAETDAEKSIAVSCGYQGIARGNLGAWLVLAERADDGEIKHVRCGKVDGKVLLPGVFYQLKNKKFVVVD